MGLTQRRKKLGRVLNDRATTDELNGRSPMIETDPKLDCAFFCFFATVLRLLFLAYLRFLGDERGKLEAVVATRRVMIPGQAPGGG